MLRRRRADRQESAKTERPAPFLIFDSGLRAAGTRAWGRATPPAPAALHSPTAAVAPMHGGGNALTDGLHAYGRDSEGELVNLDNGANLATFDFLNGLAGAAPVPTAGGDAAGAGAVWRSVGCPGAGALCP